MKFFTNKKFLFKLIATLCVCLSIFNFCTIPKAQAESLVTKAGGKLLDPVCDLVLVIGDGIMEVFQTTIMGEGASVMYDNTTTNWLTKVGKVVLFATIFAVVCVATGGLSAYATCIPLIGGFLSAGLTSGIVTGGLSIMAYSAISGAFLPEVVVLPTYYIGPEEIFSGKILLFDANIFSPKNVYVDIGKSDGTESYVIKYGSGLDITVFKNLMTDTDVLEINGQVYTKEDIDEETFNVHIESGYSFKWNNRTYSYDGDTGNWMGNTLGVLSTNGSISEVIETVTLEEWNSKDSNGEYVNSYRKAGYPCTYFYYKDGNSNNTSKDNIVHTSANNTALELKDTIAKWYFVIRNIALIGLILVLLYVGIRMLTSSIASEKSKYKQMIGDWVVALCLIFVMQYIMVFANEFVEGITNILASAAENKGHVAVIQDAPDGIINAINNNADINGEQVVQDGNIYWPTNLMGRMRILAQEKDGTTGYVGYVVCFAVLLIFTVCFVISYLRRLLYLLFLTVIAPFVAMTYPLDKIRDGKAQAFDMWFKEYICNLIIQPFHLLLYTIFVTMAFDLAGTNVIYSLVVLGFMMPAEKFLRKMFGFDRASTPGFLEGATGAAMTMTALHSLSKFAGKGPGGSKGIGDKAGGASDKEGAEYLNRGKSRSVQELLGQMSGTNNTETAVGEGQSQQQTDNRNINTPQLNDEVLGQNTEDGRRMLGNKDNEEIRQLREELDNSDYNDMYLNPEYYQQKQDRLAELENINQEPTTQSINPAPTEKIEKPSIGKRISAGARTMKRDAANISRKKVFKTAIKGAKNGLRFGSKLTLGGVGAIAGSAAGIVSGDFNSVIKNTTAGGAAGTAIGAGVSNRVIDRGERIVAGVKEANEEAIKESLGEDYSEYKRQEKDRKFKKNKEMRNLYARELGLKTKDEIDQAMNQAIEYRKYGVEDNDIILKAMTMNNGNESNRAEMSRIGAARLAMQSKSLKDLDTTMKMFEKTTGMDKKKVEKMKNDIRQINNL